MDETWMIILIEGLAVSVLGSLLHFCYEWSGKNKFVGIFAAVNESTWEHIKLALSGIFFCTLVDVWFLGSNPNYWLARSISFLTPVILIPIIFYGYTAFTKKSILMVDIASFIVAAFTSAGMFAWILTMQPVGEIGDLLSMGISVVIIAMYLLLTRFPIHGNKLFRDPVTSEYGYRAFRPLFGKSGHLAKKKASNRQRRRRK